MEWVDWNLASATAQRLSRPGPALAVTEAADVVSELRALADQATAHVAGYTGLLPDPVLHTTTAVLDRRGWAASNVAGLAITLTPMLDSLGARRAEHSGHDATGGLAGAVARRVIAVEIGSLLAFLSSRVLGQYEVFVPPEIGDGRLALVAPNIVDNERRLGVDSRDFRMWVCLHEQTHRLQFTGVPWLKGHLTELIGRLAQAADLDPQALLARLGAAVRDGVQATVRGRLGDARPDRDARPGGLLAILQGPEQRAVAAEAQAFMTLLEGHADHVMDAVGPAVVPSVAIIRERFEERRRRGRSPIDLLLRRLLGLDAKLAQYRVGGAFCRAVARAGGAEALAAVFASPASLPTAAELRDPSAWLTRVVGVGV